MKNKFIGLLPLILLQVVIVGNLQVLPSNALYGFSLPFLYLLAVIGFYLPCLVMTAQLAIKYPQTGGAYVWCEYGFTKKMGFVAASLLWFSNLLWYPSLFTLIGANFAYLFNPALAHNKLFVVGFGLLLFWTITALNCLGVRLSVKLSIIASVLGIMVPMIIIIFCGIDWYMRGNPLAISLAQTPLIPKLTQFQNLSYLIAIVISLFGIEIAAIHAGNVSNPKKNFPISLIISSFIVILLLLASEISIAMIIPAAQLNIITGLLDGIIIFFTQVKLANVLFLILLMILLGNIGSAAAWMLGSTRSMFVACTDNHVYPFLQKINRYESPVGVLFFEAIIFTMASGVFLLFPTIIDSFWLLLVLASQVTLIYYLLLFTAALRLGCPRILMALGFFTSLLAFVLGFIAPADLTSQQINVYHLILIIGIIASIVLPIYLIRRSK